MHAPCFLPKYFGVHWLRQGGGWQNPFVLQPDQSLQTCPPVKGKEGQIWYEPVPYLPAKKICPIAKNLILRQMDGSRKQNGHLVPQTRERPAKKDLALQPLKSFEYQLLLLTHGQDPD